MFMSAYAPHSNAIGGSNVDVNWIVTANKMQRRGGRSVNTKYVRRGRLLGCIIRTES